MAKKPASFEYNGTLVKVLDGDRIDAYIDLGFDLKIKKRIRYMGIDTWESRTRDLDEKKKGLAAKTRNKELLEAGTFKIISYGTGKFGRVLGEIFVSPDVVGHEISENVDKTSDGLVSINDILINEGHAYEYDGGKKKKFVSEIEKEKAAKKKDLVDKPVGGRMKSIMDVLEQVTEFIIGKEPQSESLLDKKKKTIGFVADGVKPKRKYTRRKKKNAVKKQK